jgi:hypothetical protein
MNKREIVIPKGIEYISQWEGYEIPRGEHCIVDKGVTGCGYTEFALRNKDFVVLCSPRKLLLENKSEKHLKEGNINVLYLDGLTYDDMRDRVRVHLNVCLSANLPPKFLITYDSTGKLVNCLKDFGMLSRFIFVVDEFQSIFLDSYFKVGVEFDFVNNLRECESVVYLSATPMLDKYLDRLDDFKDLMFYKLDWSETGYVETVVIERKRTNALTSECCKIINEYLNGVFPLILDNEDNSKILQSREAVFYFNSVSEILRIVRKCSLTPENTIIVCSKSDKNKKKLKEVGFDFGRIPLADEPNPMFTFCTSAVYMGVDFYSDCASSYVFADPNVDCLALDISLDLPQIIGRQRNKNNPFKNFISLFYKTKRDGETKLTEDNFKKYLEKKREKTQNLLNIYNKVSAEEKRDYIDKLRESIEYSNYSKDFISISEKTGEPIYNTLIDIADQRAWEVAQKDYQDKISVTKALKDIKGLNIVTQDYRDRDEIIISSFLNDYFFKTNIFKEKMKMYCEFREKFEDNPYIISSLEHRISDQRFHQYFKYYGISGCKARKYEELELRRVWEDSTKEEKLGSMIYSKFKEGDRVAMSEMKETLRTLYSNLSLSKSPKATDILDYFEVSKTNITTKDGVKKGFKLGRKLR